MEDTSTTPIPISFTSFALFKTLHSFRSSYEYNNIIFSLPGYCAARATKTTWDDLIKNYLLDPLGMTASTTNLSDFINSSNHASTYKLLCNGTLIPYGPLSEDWDAPAGSMACSINELVNWLNFQIADTGMYNGVQIVSKKDLDETRTPQIMEDEDKWCGLGWVLSDDFIRHSGSTESSTSYVAIRPYEGIGIAVLSNQYPYGNAFNKALLDKLNDLLDGNENTDPWIADKKLIDPLMIPVLPDPTPPIVQPLPLETYIGVYSNDFYDNLTITSNNDTLTCYYGKNEQPFNLTHWNVNTFEDKIHNIAMDFKDISNGTAHQIDTSLVDYTTTPSSAALFNRTNST